MIIAPADVLVIDDPWKYRNWSDTARGAASAHYPGLTYPELQKLTPTIESLRNPDSVVFMWTTWPKLDQGMDLLRERGWDYVTGFPWIKTVADLTKVKRTVGFWSQGCSEVVLIGRTGSVGTTGKLKYLKGGDLEEGQVLGLLCGSERQFYDRIMQHSRKPYGIAEWLEEKFPGASFMELFATEERPGWRCYGHRTGHHVAEEGIIPLADAKAKGLVPMDYDPFAAPVRQPKRGVRMCGCKCHVPGSTKQDKKPCCPGARCDNCGKWPKFVEAHAKVCVTDRKVELIAPETFSSLDAAISGF